MIPQAITSSGGAFNPRMILAAALCLMGVCLAAFSFGAPSLKGSARSTSASSMGSTLTANAVGNWAIVASPNAAEQSLLSVGCVSNSDCWAVGYYYDGNGVGRTLVEHWNGSAWSIVPSPTPTGRYYNSLSGVTCVSTADCWSVGYSYEQPPVGQVKYHTLIEHWDGTSWSIVPSPDPSPTRNRLYDVTCISSSNCWAAGNSRFSSTIEKTLVEHWDGSAWSVVTSPNVGTSINLLRNIRCVSASNCWAVGGTFDTANSVYQTLTEHWDGSAWSIVASPNTAADQENFLYSIACVSATDCWTVGYHHNGTYDSEFNPILETLIEHWNGVAWSIVSSPSTSPTQINYLNEVTCTSTNQCWAVGSAISYDEHSHQSVIEQWNGSSWSIVASPPDTIGYDYLVAVTCPSGSQCWTVGNTGWRTLAERWDGNTWSTVNTPNAAGGGSNDILSDVTCTSTSNCWAVGTDNFGDPFIQHWDGNSWSITTAAYPSNPRYSVLSGVTCTSASDCWAVGDYYDANLELDQTLTAHWNGSSWSVVSSPSVAGADNYLLDVSCASASDCWAVGDSAVAGALQTLIEHWNGSSWSIVSSPSVVGQPLNFLRGVTCTSVSNCWAVGDSGNNDTSTEATLIEHWDGISWSIVGSPNQQQQNNLEAVTCVAASDCWAVGFSFGNNSGNALIEHWNGSAWSLALAPPDGSGFNDVSCASATNCWAVGESSGTRSAHWDGSSWTTVPSPSITSSDKLYGVACPSAIRCFAVGEYQAGDEFSPIRQTLIEQFTAGLQVTSAGRSHGQFALTGQTVANALVDIQASPDLIAPFVTINTVTSDANGVFEYIDLNSSSFQKRFYRAVFP
jgi:hypothetical protein